MKRPVSDGEIAIQFPEVKGLDKVLCGSFHRSDLFEMWLHRICNFVTELCVLKNGIGSAAVA